MIISLTPTLESMVEEKVASGLYSDASEVVREALRLLEVRDRYASLRLEASKGSDQLQRGMTTSLDMKTAKARAVENSKQGRKVNPLVAP